MCKRHTPELSKNELCGILEAKKGGVTVRKRTLIVLGAAATVIVLFLLGLYLFGRPVTGVWVRQMDDNGTLAGMTVEVRRNNGTLEGRIIELPAGADSFEVGQIKWAKIKKAGYGKYQFYNLASTSNLSGISYQYVDGGYIVVAQNGDSLTIAIDTDALSLGKHQIWVKQK